MFLLLRVILQVCGLTLVVYGLLSMNTYGGSYHTLWDNIYIQLALLGGWLFLLPIPDPTRAGLLHYLFDNSIYISFIYVGYMIGNEFGLGTVGSIVSGSIGCFLAIIVQSSKPVNAFFDQMLVKADD